MKLFLKPILILSLLINYCFAICINNNTGLLADIESNNVPVQDQNYFFSNVKLNLFSYLIKNENLINNLNKLPSSFDKKKNYDSLKHNHPRESYFLGTFSNYISKEEFTYQFFSSTDIIYPFHYFL